MYLAYRNNRQRHRTYINKKSKDSDNRWILKTNIYDCTQDICQRSEEARIAWENNRRLQLQQLYKCLRWNRKEFQTEMLMINKNVRNLVGLAWSVSIWEPHLVEKVVMWNKVTPGLLKTKKFTEKINLSLALAAIIHVNSFPRFLGQWPRSPFR